MAELLGHYVSDHDEDFEGLDGCDDGEEEGEFEFDEEEMQPTASDPIVMNLSACRYRIVYEAARACNFTISERPIESDDKWTIWFMDKSSATRRVRKLKDYQRINHYPFIDTIARKHKLTRVMKRMSLLFPNDYDFYPLGWELPQEYLHFKKWVAERRRGGGRPTFIGKPNADSCSRGIKLSRSVREFDGEKESIVQLYIDNPLLLEGLKFDLRVYLLIMSVHPLTLYMYEEGIVRICAEPYRRPNKSNIDTSCMHFTNFTLNKKHKNFIAQTGTDYSTGHKRNFGFLRRWLAEEHGKDPDEIFAIIENVLVKTAIAAQPTLERYYLEVTEDARKRGGSFTCFEVLGFDIMFDKKFHPWLLEVNHSPSFNLGTPMDHVLKLGLLSEAFQLLAIDPTRRKKTLRRERLLREAAASAVAGDGPSASASRFESEFAEVMPMSREQEAAGKRWAERTRSKLWKRIYPVEGSEERYAQFFNSQEPPIQMYVPREQRQ